MSLATTALLYVPLNALVMDYLLREGITQQQNGAHILDVNVGLPEIDEPALLRRAVTEIQSVVDLPLQIDTSDTTAMEAAMRIYNGKPLINSVNGKEESMLLPIFVMLTTALKPAAEIFRFPPTFIPNQFVFSNFVTVFDKLNYLPYFFNSLFVSSCIVVGTIISSSLVAFGFSRYNARGKNILFMLVMSALMIPYPSVMIPQYILFNNLRWVNTYLPLIVPTFFGSAYMIFLLRQFFSSISNELFEAARIDGCNEFRIFWKIALPLSKTALATVAIFSFMR